MPFRIGDAVLVWGVPKCQEHLAGPIAEVQLPGIVLAVDEWQVEVRLDDGRQWRVTRFAVSKA